MRTRASSEDGKSRRRFDPWRVASVLACVCIIATCMSFLGRYHWLLEWLSHFHVQYLACLLLFSIAFLAGKKIKMAAMCGVFIVVNLVVILPLFLCGPEVKGRGDLKLMLININSLNRRHERVENSVRRANPDIVLLMEVNQRWLDALETLRKEYPHWAARPRPDNFGIAFFCRFPAEIDIRQVGPGVPMIVARMATPRGTMTIIGAHPVPPVNREFSAERNRQLETLANLASSLEGPVLLAGDLNVTPWSPYFKRLLERSGLGDARQGFGLQTTWPDGLFFLRVPIDHCLYSKEITITDFEVGDSIGSDHFPVLVSLRLNS